MVIWRVTGDEIGPNGNGAAYFPAKAEAEARLREHRRDDPGRVRGDAPEKIVIRNRGQLAEALNDAMGYGCS